MVDVMHLSTMANGSDRSPPHHFSPGHKAGISLRQKERSHSSQDLSTMHGSAADSPSRSSAGGDSLSASEMSWSGTPEEQQAVEHIQQSRRQLEDEIDVSISFSEGRA